MEIVIILLIAVEVVIVSIPFTFATLKSYPVI